MWARTPLQSPCNMIFGGVRLHNLVEASPSMLHAEESACRLHQALRHPSHVLTATTPGTRII
eukprot:47519-Amphidinium_carterae.1